MNTKKLILSSLVCFSFIIGTINITANAAPNEESSDYISLSKLTASKKGTITNPSKDTVEYKFLDNIIKIDFTSPFININDKIIPLETEELNGLKLPNFKAKFKRNAEDQIIVKSSLIKETLNIEVNEKEEKKEDKAETETTNELTNQDKEENTNQNVTTNTKPSHNTTTSNRPNHKPNRPIGTTGSNNTTTPNNNNNNNSNNNNGLGSNNNNSDSNNNNSDNNNNNSSDSNNNNNNSGSDNNNNNDNNSKPDTGGDNNSSDSNSGSLKPSHESGVQKQPNTN